MGYYSGDPGFFSFLGGIAKKAVGFIPGVGPAISTALSAIPSSPARTMSRAALTKVGSAIVKHPVLSAAGAAASVGSFGIAAHQMMGGPGGARGKHPSARHMRALAMGLKRARPRMNVTNVHALRRALRRTHGFARLAMKVIHITHPKKKGRFGGFRKRRRK